MFILHPSLLMTVSCCTVSFSSVLSHTGSLFSPSPSLSLIQYSLSYSLEFILSPSYSVLLFNWIFIDMLILHIILPKQYKKKNLSASNNNKNKSYKINMVKIPCPHICKCGNIYFSLSQWFKYAWDSMVFVPSGVVCLTEWTTNLYHLQREI